MNLIFLINTQAGNRCLVLTQNYRVLWVEMAITDTAGHGGDRGTDRGQRGHSAASGARRRCGWCGGRWEPPSAGGDVSSPDRHTDPAAPHVCRTPRLHLHHTKPCIERYYMHYITTHFYEPRTLTDANYFTRYDKANRRESATRLRVKADSLCEYLSQSVRGTTVGAWRSGEGALRCYGARSGHVHAANGGSVSGRGVRLGAGTPRSRGGAVTRPRGTDYSRQSACGPAPPALPRCGLRAPCCAARAAWPLTVVAVAAAR
ncbi:unnamed protein product [Colias eurytheme]|nr:unnamed protein product [Colias eurytheme]